LPSLEFSLLEPKLKLVDLPLNQLLMRTGEPIEFFYFIDTAVASILNLMQDGKSVEVGLAGKEGVVGLPLLGGFKTSAHRVVAQGEGTAYRLKAADFTKLLPQCASLQMALVRYSQRLLMQATQIAACNRLHEVDERLARWLLMTHDRTIQAQLPLTQEFLSQMLGTRRASVSVAAGILQKRGLIRYARGRITILDRPGLEGASCECYQAIQRQAENWESER
jgi:CRP-like cAMP-binding protein